MISDLKYLETLLDLLRNKEFVLAIKDYRKKLGIPIGGFPNHKTRSNFRYKKTKLENEFEATKKELEEKYADDADILKKALQWHDFYNSGKEIRSIIKKFNLPMRTSGILPDIIMYSKSYIPQIKKGYKKTDSGARYGCTLHVDSPVEGYPDLILEEIRKIKSMHLHEDLSAAIMIYPETKKSDITKMLKQDWYLVKMQQKKQENKNKLKLKNIRVKESRKLHERILRLHKQGLTAPQIAKKLEPSHDLRWDYIRKIVSDMKKCEN